MYTCGEGDHSVQVENHRIWPTVHLNGLTCLASRIDEHNRTSGVTNHYSRCAVLMVPMPVPCHNDQVHILFMSNICQLRSCLAAGDFQLETNPGMECPFGNNALHEFFHPSGPFMLR